MSNAAPSSNEYKNQHYLPQLYLKNFTSLTAPGKVWVLRRGFQHWSDCGIKSVARSEYLHSILEDSGDWNHETEQMFSQIEREWKPVLEKVLNRCPLTDLEESIFACSLGVLWQRTPTAVEPINKFFSEVGNAALHLANSMAKEKKDFSGIKVRYNPLLALMATIQTGVDMGEMIWSMEWRFLHSQPPHFFITSEVL